MKILFLTHHYLPETAAAAKRISGLAKNLKEFGHDVDILTNFPSYPDGIKQEVYSKKFYMKEIIDDIKVYRYYVYASPKKNNVNRMLNYTSFMFSSLFFLANKNKYDVIIVTSPPIFISLSGFIISKIKRIPLVYDIRDLWPDTAYEMGYMNKESLSYKIMDYIAILMYKNSKLITVVTEPIKQKLLYKGINQNKISVINNGFDIEFLNNDIDQSLNNKYNIENKFTVIYAGIIGVAQGVSIIVDVANNLKEYKNIQFIIIGEGVEREKLEKISQKLNLNNIHFLGNIDHKKIYTFLKLSKLSIVPLKNKKINDGIPTKMLESLGVGCPVILSASGESAEILKESKGGIVVEPGDSEALSKAIIDIYNNPKYLDDMKIKGQEYVLENFNRENIAKKLEKVLKKKMRLGKYKEFRVE